VELSEFLGYLATQRLNGDGRIPSLTNLSRELGVSISVLREQLEVARALGLVEVRPKTGIRRLEYSFRPAVRKSLAYALALKPDYFSYFSDLRCHVEIAYWYQAVCLLTIDDQAVLTDLVDRAKQKLSRKTIQIPHQEHRELHLAIFRHVENPFVTGLLEAYWDLYEEFGLDRYTDVNYLQIVWGYHEKMVEAIKAENYDLGCQALKDHIGLIDQRSRSIVRPQFE
jgi:DNA-binding FadR family transcriptional regulator